MVDIAFWTFEMIRSKDISEKLLLYILEQSGIYRPHIWFGGQFTRNKNIEIHAGDEVQIIKAILSPYLTYCVFTNKDRKNAYRFSDILYTFLRVLTLYNLVQHRSSYALKKGWMIL